MKWDRGHLLNSERQLLVFRNHVLALANSFYGIRWIDFRKFADIFAEEGQNLPLGKSPLKLSQKLQH